MQSLGHSVGDDFSHNYLAATSNAHISNVVFVATVTVCIHMYLCMWTHYNIMHLSSCVVVVVTM